MAGLVTIDDLQALMKKTFAGEDQAEAQLVIDCVSAWARVQSGQLWPDAPATGVPSDVRAVVLMASRRELKNPDRVITRSMGPFNVTYSAPPDGFFYPAELAILGRFRRSGGLRTVATTRGEHGRPWAGFIPPENWNPWEGTRPDMGFDEGYLLYGDGDGLFPFVCADDPQYGNSIRPGGG